jgi:hypothetical protein
LDPGSSRKKERKTFLSRPWPETASVSRVILQSDGHEHLSCSHHSKAFECGTCTATTSPSKCGLRAVSVMIMVILHQMRHGRQDNHATNHVKCTKRARQGKAESISRQPSLWPVIALSQARTPVSSRYRTIGPKTNHWRECSAGLGSFAPFVTASTQQQLARVYTDHTLVLNTGAHTDLETNM